MKFVDEVSLYLESGNGGPGSVHFRKEKYVPRGGPDGGDGGRGGNVVLKVNSRLNSLIDLYHKRKLSAQNGQPGEGQRMSGASGKDLIVEIPPGTIVRDENQILADLSEGEMVLYAGGRGGKGNWFFKTSVNQAPMHAQPGEPGEGAQVWMELKLIADIGLIGFPNVGKSTIISRVSAAKPKIADYPFTTLTPNLGVVQYAETDSFVVADIPGLVEGASEGVGLGIQFLRHIERTKAFVHVIDVSGMTGRDPWEDFQQINAELAKYDDSPEKSGLGTKLSERPQLVVLNKTDTISSEVLDDIKLKFIREDIPVLPLSAVTGDGTKKLIEIMGRKVFAEESDSENFWSEKI